MPKFKVGDVVRFKEDEGTAWMYKCNITIYEITDEYYKCTYKYDRNDKGPNSYWGEHWYLSDDHMWKYARPSLEEFVNDKLKVYLNAVNS